MPPLPMRYGECYARLVTFSPFAAADTFTIDADFLMPLLPLVTA